MGESPPDSRSYTLSAAYALRLLDLVARWGVDEHQLFEGFGLRRSDLSDPDRSLPIDTAVAILQRAVALTGEDALGIYLGLQMNSTAHGILGFAAMSAKTVRDALLVSVRYSAIRTTALSLRTYVTERVGTLVLEEHVDLGPAREAYALAILLGFWRMGCALAGEQLDNTLDFAFPKPAYFDRFERVLPPTRFGQPAHQLMLHNLSQLEMPLATADDVSFRLARDQCHQLLQSMGLDGRLGPRVRSLLARSEGNVPSLQAVARGLRLSSRTLRRHLEAEGITFSALADDERRRRALLLLRSRELSVQEIGARLGYSDIANFTRAFRRWTGKTPTAYRNGEATG